MLRLQQQQMLLRSKIDRVYDDRLSDAIPQGTLELEISGPAGRASRTRAERLFLDVAKNLHE